MTWTAQEDFADAARRHLRDAEFLADAGRWDGVVHLAGFAAECALKAALERRIGPMFAGRDHGHDLEQLTGWVWDWTGAVHGDTAIDRALDRASDPVLSHHHPDRRYWVRGWDDQDGVRALRAARSLVELEVAARVLDLGSSWGED